MLFERVPCQPASSTPCALALVSDHPSDAEVCFGKPLIGPHGKLLNQALRLAGIKREDCWVGSVFERQPPENHVKNWCVPERSVEGQSRYPGAGYLPAEQLPEFDRLAAELEAAQPSVIIPLGGTALWCFTGSTVIGEARGAIQRATLIRPGAKLLPTFAPGYVLRQYKMLGTVVGDLKKAKAEALRPEDTLRLTKRELWINPTLADIEEFTTRYLEPAERITIDIETAAGQISEIGFGADAHRAITVRFVDYTQADRCYWPSLDEELAAWDAVKRICALPAPKLFQNGPFDNWYLIRRGIPVTNWRDDTRLLHHALYPELPKSLAYMGAAYAQEGPWKLYSSFRKKDEKRDA